MRSPLLLLLALAACEGRAPADGPAASAPAPEAADAAEGTENPGGTVEARGRAAGLSAAQAARLAALDHLVVVPAALGPFALAERPAIEVESDSASGAFYVGLPYVGPDSTCFMMRSTNDGIGDVPFGDAPSRTVRMPAFGLDAEVFQVSTDPADEDAEIMGPGATGTPWVEMGSGASATFFSLLSPGNVAPGCRPASAADVDRIVASLRPLDPERDAVH